MRLAALAAIAMMLSGCVAGSTTMDVDTRTTNGVGQTMNVPGCSDQPEFSYSIARLEGSLNLQVLDGNGAMAFNRDFSDADYSKGGSEATGSNAHGLFGAAGEWSIRATWDESDVAFTATLSC